ncbi:MAG: radical SAM protein [Candidatus Pacearchaeota archaeon]
MIKGLKILLISSFKNESLRVGQYLSPSFGLYRIASYLNKRFDIKIKIFDPDLEGIDNLNELIRNNKFDIIGFSLLQPTLKNDIPLIYSVNKISPESLLIAGGQGAGFNSEFLLNNTPLQIITKGFGEFSLGELIKNFDKQGTLVQRFGGINGLVIKNSSEIYETKPVSFYSPEFFKEISLDFDFSIIPYERYWNLMKQVYTEEHLKIMKNENMLCTIRLVTSSHCPMKCKFCSSTNFLDDATACKQKVILLEPEDIMIMMKNALIFHKEVEAFYFCDDDFLQNKQRTYRLCELIKKDKDFEGLTFYCLSRPDRIDSELLGKMREVGFKFIIYGVDSFSNKVLEDMNKHMISLDKKTIIKEAVIKTLNADIVPLMNIILFYPTSSISDILETIEDSIELIDKDARLTVYTYVETYSGADILNDGFEYVYETFNYKDKEFKLPKTILPSHKDVRVLAENAIELRNFLLPRILTKYNWEGVVPHPLYGLILFLAVYKLLNLDTTKIEELIEKIMRLELVNSNKLNLITTQAK